MAAAVLLSAVLYVILVNVLVSAALVPAFMRRLDAFQRITEESYAAQVQTSDIQVNHQLALNETEEWLETVRMQKISVTTGDGYTLIAAEFFPPETTADMQTGTETAQYGSAASPVISKTTAAAQTGADSDGHRWALILHGYTGWKEEMYPFACRYQRQGYHVIVPDLRCQGESEGDFIGMGWTDHFDCRLWIAYILRQDPDAVIVIHGQSMGAATALMMAGEADASAHIAAVVSDSAYTDAYAMFGDKIKDWFHLPAFPLVDSARLALLARGGYDLLDASAIDAVAKSKVPTLFIHGAADVMIPSRMSEELYAAASCPKELLIIDGAGHGQPQDKDPEAYYGTIEAFLAKYAGSPRDNRAEL